MDNGSKMVPELVVTDFDRSLSFWCHLIGFEIVYDRPEEKFAYLNLDGAQVMLEQYNALDRDWETAPLEPPLGRGINFQIEVPQLQPILERLHLANWPVFIAVEERWYTAQTLELGQRQFLVQDPDGYLLRLIEDFGSKAKSCDLI